MPRFSPVLEVLLQAKGSREGGCLLPSVAEEESYCGGECDQLSGTVKAHSNFVLHWQFTLIDVGGAHGNEALTVTKTNSKVWIGEGGAAKVATKGF